MGIDTAINQFETDSISWNGIAGHSLRSKERFPWEHGSPRETWLGRIGALLFGAILAVLVFLSNEETVTALKDDTMMFASAFVLRPARTNVPSAPADRHKPEPAGSPIYAPPVLQNVASAPPRVQLGSYSSKAQALAASDRMRQSHATILEGRQLTVVEAIVGRTQFYRVVIDLQSDRAARDLCDAIKKENVDCLVWRSTAAEKLKSNQ